MFSNPLFYGYLMNKLSCFRLDKPLGKKESPIGKRSMKILWVVFTLSCSGAIAFNFSKTHLTCYRLRK